jgi:hypothetical protein
LDWIGLLFPLFCFSGEKWLVGWLYGAFSEQLQLLIYSEFRLGFIMCIIGVIQSFLSKLVCQSYQTQSAHREIMARSVTHRASLTKGGSLNFDYFKALLA